jgi:3-oxoacyl-[acyl-carrier-protein] synthase-3
MTTIGIRDVAAWRPAGSIDTVALGAGLDAEPGFIAEKIGMQALARKHAAHDTSDLGREAALALFARAGLRPEQVELLVVVTQNPDGRGLPHTAAVLHHKLGLPRRCVAFDIGLGCSGYVQALAVCKALMEAQGLKNGLLVTADPYSKVIDDADRDTALLFGDGATATWLGESPTWRIGTPDFGIVSEQHGALAVNADGVLRMNGRAVFTFAATQVPASVQRVLGAAGRTMDDVDLVLLHQGSRYIVDTLAQRIGAAGKAPFHAGPYGNTVSSSLPMLLAEHVPPSAGRLLLCGFGVGLAWACCLLERTHADQ